MPKSCMFSGIFFNPIMFHNLFRLTTQIQSLFCLVIILLYRKCLNAKKIKQKAFLFIFHLRKINWPDVQPLQVFFEDKNRVLPYINSNFDGKRKASKRRVIKMPSKYPKPIKNVDRKCLLYVHRPNTYKERQLKPPYWTNKVGWTWVNVRCCGALSWLC